jgi:hypothetical protein
MNEWTNDELTGVLSEIARRSTVDLEFRNLALKNPAAAIAKISTRPLPSSISIQFLDNSGSVKHFPLPDPVSEVEELSEAELAAIAGGDFFVTGNVASGPTGPTVGGSGGWHR